MDHLPASTLILLTRPYQRLNKDERAGKAASGFIRSPAALAEIADGARRIAAMSGKGNCYDNAAVDTFFKPIKAEPIWRRSWETRRQAEMAIFEYIDGFYNPRRRHSALGWNNPVALLRTHHHLSRCRGVLRVDHDRAAMGILYVQAREKLQGLGAYWRETLRFQIL